MRSPSATFASTIASDQVPFARLVEIQLDTTVRYALYANDVTFDSTVYTANSGEIGAIEQNLEGKAPRLTLSLQNLDRVARDLINTADERGTVIVIRVVMTDDLGDATAQAEDTFELDAYSWDGSSVQFQLAASPILRRIQVPGRRTQTWYCEFAYKGPLCGYVGDIKTCDFTYDGKNGCTKHFAKDEAKRFSGFIGKPQAGLVVR
jgi:phage-related protein